MSDEVPGAKAREWTETTVYIAASLFTTYAVLHQAGVEIDYSWAKKRLERVRATVDRMPWMNPKRWRKMVTAVLLEAWNIVEGEEDGD